METTVDLSRLKKVALISAGVGLIACIAGYITDHAQFAQSWLMGWNYWFFIASGALGWLLIHHLAGGYWSYLLQRPLEAAARTIPLMMILFMPILFSMPELYSWSRAEVIAQDPLVQHKLPYLTGFQMRFVMYAVVWSALIFALSTLSRRLDTYGEMKLVQRMRIMAGPGLVIFALSTTFASFDWLMSLEPHWFSSIYGALYLIWQGLSTLLFMAIVLHGLSSRPPVQGVITAQQFHDIGNLSFAFILLWAYLNFGQFLIIWSGNLHEKTFWFIKRSSGGWLMVSWVLCAFHFILPFFLLLIRNNKRRSGILAGVALLVLAVRYVDVYWQVAPTFRSSPTLHWLDLAALMTVGGFFLYAFAQGLGKVRFLAKDPRFATLVSR
jgi:hypothetical protein